MTTPRLAAWCALAVLVAGPPVPPVLAQTPAPVRTVPSVDLTRYAGDWFEVARFPNRFQRRCTGDVRASYALRPDGQIDVLNRCRTADGEISAKGLAQIGRAHV